MFSHSLQGVPGVKNETAATLIDAGITTPFLLSIASVDQLIDLGLSKDKAEELIKNARDLAEIKYITPSEFAEKFFGILSISTGSRSLNEVLDGGIETTTMVEFFGPSASGKSQICMQLAVNAQLKENDGGIESKVIYIDTENSFNPRRVEELAGIRGIPSKDALKNIFYVRVDILSDLFDKVDKAEKLLSRRDTRVLIIDNIINPFRIQLEKKDIRERQRLLYKLLWRLLLYADRLDAAVVFTNRVYSLPDPLNGAVIRPFGGLVVDISTHKKILLRKHENEIYRAYRINDHERKIFFKISSDGVGDI